VHAVEADWRWDAGDAGRRGVGGQRLGRGIEGDGAACGH
jgi:hypothetical protein